MPSIDTILFNSVNTLRNWKKILQLVSFYWWENWNNEKLKIFSRFYTSSVWLWLPDHSWHPLFFVGNNKDWWMVGGVKRDHFKVLLIMSRLLLRLLGQDLEPSGSKFRHWTCQQCDFAMIFNLGLTFHHYR